MARINIDIMQPAPDQAVFDAVLAQRIRSLKRYRTQGVIGVLVGVAGMVSGFLSAVPPLLTYALIVGGLFAALLALSWTESNPDDACTPLAQDCCAEMKRYCDATPETRHYANAVRAQGRQFVKGEFLAMRDLVQQQDCKVLYGVAV